MVVHQASRREITFQINLKLTAIMKALSYKRILSTLALEAKTTTLIT